MRAGALASALAAGMLAWSPPTVAAQTGEVADDARAFVEVETMPDPCYTGQVFAVQVRVLVDTRFFAEHALQLFHRRLDVPVQVEVAWPGSADATPLDATDDDGGPRLTLALSDAIVAAVRAPDQTRDGRSFTVLSVTRRFVAAREGTLELPQARLRFAYTTRFVDDFVQGRVGVDRHEVAIESAPPRLRVVPLPTAGRPATFSGAVGRFTVHAETSAREIEGRASFPLLLRIEGEGNLHAFDPPTLALAGFHVLGSIDAKGNGRRTITYDVVSHRAGDVGIPPIPFSFFDPTPPGAYRTVSTAPLPLVVRGDPGTRTALDVALGRSTGTAGVDDIFGVRTVPFDAGDTRYALRFLFPLALLGPWLLAAGFVAWRRARLRAAQDHLGRRARGAAAAFGAQLGSSSDPATAFTTYLAARLRCAPAAVISPDLRERLTAARVPADLAARTVAAIDALVAARYGSLRHDDVASTTTSLVGALERAFAEADA